MKFTNLKQFKKHIKKSPTEFGVLALILVLFAVSAFPAPAAEAYGQVGNAIDSAKWETNMAVAKIQNESMPFGSLPESGRAEPRYLTTVTVTAYNSVPGQTDATPCIGAQGTDICQIYNSGENVCAANFVPLGTVLVVEGLGECTVRDRMNARYYYRVDWYMGMDVAAARSFGVRQKAISIYPSA